MSLRFCASIAAACLAMAALGCLNDRDSLASEAGRRPGMLEDLVGWFPVHPDLYYRMRIALSGAELKAHPDNLELYDDIAVAYDRINEDANAIDVIERKRAVLIRRGIKSVTSKQPVNPNLYGEELRETAAKSSRDPWYRYYANAGTFLAHRWIHAGRPKEHRDWIDQAQRDIDRAIEINPYAHELREFAQADVIRWLREGESGEMLSDFMNQVQDSDGRKKATALAGLIELGGAWESVDVYEAIAHSENDDLSYIAEQRVYELQKAGKRSLTGHVFDASDFHATERISTIVGPNTDDEYRMLRKAADDYRAYRIDYELARLQQGRHPDTDPHFYDDFQTREFPHFGFELGGYLFWFFLEGPGCLAIPLLLAAFIVRSVWRRKRGK